MIFLCAGDTLKLSPKLYLDGKYYQTFSGLTTKDGNGITVGGGSNLSCQTASLFGNVINIGDAAAATMLGDSNAKLFSDNREAIAIIAAKSITDSFKGLTSARTIEATSDNTINITNAAVGAANQYNTAPRIEVYGGKMR